MKIFIDTSSLIKLYHYEVDTDRIDALLRENPISEIYLSELAKVEFFSAIWKKVRTKDLSEIHAIYLINAFKTDFSKFSFIKVQKDLIENATKLIVQYGKLGLRTLDSIQLASILSVKEHVSFVLTSDILLKNIVERENIYTK